jgi:hypothetical protein
MEATPAKNERVSNVVGIGFWMRLQHFLHLLRQALRPSSGFGGINWLSTA